MLTKACGCSTVRAGFTGTVKKEDNMSPEDAYDIADESRSDGNPCYVAVDVFKKGLDRYDGISLAEIYLSEYLPGIGHIAGIASEDEAGIWFYDGDGHIDDFPLYRVILVPWGRILSITLHQRT